MGKRYIVLVKHKRKLKHGEKTYEYYELREYLGRKLPPVLEHLYNKRRKAVQRSVVRVERKPFKSRSLGQVLDDFS